MMTNRSILALLGCVSGCGFGATATLDESNLTATSPAAEEHSAVQLIAGNPQVVTACAEGRHEFAVLNEIDRHQNVRLSSDGLRATTTTTLDGVRGTIGKRSGRSYFEVAYASAGAFGGVGVGGSDQYLELEPGSTDYGCGLGFGGDLSCSFGAYRAFGSSLPASGIVQVAVDLDSRRAFFGVNGQWRVNPETDIGLDIGYDSTCGEIFPIVSLSEGDEFNVNFGQSPFMYEVPDGFSAGWFTDGCVDQPRCRSLTSVGPLSCELVTNPQQIRAMYPPSVSLENCGSGGFKSSNYTNQALSACYSEELHVVSVYESGREDGHITVRVLKSDSPVVLSLNSYDPVIWDLQVDDDAELSRVVVQSYEGDSVVNAPEGTTIASMSFRGCAYAWEAQGSGGGCVYSGLIGAVRDEVDMMERSFQGCYPGTSFTVPF